MKKIILTLKKVSVTNDITKVIYDTYDVVIDLPVGMNSKESSYYLVNELEKWGPGVINDIVKITIV